MGTKPIITAWFAAVVALTIGSNYTAQGMGALQLWRGERCLRLRRPHHSERTWREAGRIQASSGETEDALYVWLPEKKVLFSGDNFYKSWPNAYAIRGTPYRDIRSWADANDMMSKEGDAQWCAELCDRLLALNPDDQEIRNLKADALEHLAEDLITATGRNYYLTVAQELRKPIER